MRRNWKILSQSIFCFFATTRIVARLSHLRDWKLRIAKNVEIMYKMMLACVYKMYCILNVHAVQYKLLLKALLVNFRSFSRN